MLTAAALLLCPSLSPAMGSLPTGPSESGTETELVDTGMMQGMVSAQVRFLPDRTYQVELEKAILEAKREVVVTAHYFEVAGEKQDRPRRIAELLAAAVRRNIDTVVVVELGKESSFITQANRNAARFLKERGVKVYGDMSGTVVHSNLVIIDRRLLFMGSADFTHPSLGRYREAVIAVDSPALATEVLRYIETLEPYPYQDGSRP